MWTDITREKHARKGLRYSSDLTDAEWSLLSRHFPEPCVVGRPRKHGFRAILDAILYVLRGGIVWRMLPKDLRTLRRPLNVVAIPALTFLSMSRRQISKDPTISRRNSGNLPSQLKSQPGAAKAAKSATILFIPQLPA